MALLMENILCQVYRTAVPYRSSPLYEYRTRSLDWLQYTYCTSDYEYGLSYRVQYCTVLLYNESQYRTGTRTVL